MVDGQYMAELVKQQGHDADGNMSFLEREAFSGGWRISEESFMQGASDCLSNLKLRVSWGKTGNNSTGNYDWQANYATGNVVIDGEGTKGLVRKKLSNDKLHWESTATTDIGLDFGFFNHRLTGEIDYYVIVKLTVRQ